MAQHFTSRHIGPRQEDVQQMLDIIGVKDLDQLIEQTIPDAIRMEGDLDLNEAMSEQAYLAHIYGIGEKNQVLTSYIGCGYYPSNTPAVIQRNILENPGWYTAYTPYQAEIAQGRLEGLLNFQTMAIELSGMEIANASLLDEATAAAEAMSMLFAARTRSQQKASVNKCFVSEDMYPQTLALLRTRSEPIGIELVVGRLEDFIPDASFYAAMLQYPSATGSVKDMTAFAA
ncbi:MAG: glycine dehydrogenase (aminomethyl-transferring), partial [Flavobacteriales bacterium]|nr:glycine dehydrogenase (aminomethyl-transferring) [Flavobacteriales bacterium]